MIWALVGWLGNGCFFSRFLVQWWASERAGHSVAPRVFWWLSLAGSACLVAYTGARGELVLLAGQLVNTAIYARNLRIERAGARGLRPELTLAIGALAFVWLFAVGALQPRVGFAQAPGWLACSALGQGLWSARFVLQWVASERRRASHFPRSFWWLSLAGNALLLAYVLYLGDPVLIAAFLFAPVVQVRNLVLEHRRAAGSRPSSVT